MKRIKLWHWGAMIILCAMVTLVYMSWHGLRGQRALVWDDARSNCSVWAQNISLDFNANLEKYKSDFVQYQNPPTPGDIDFNGKADTETLEKWKRDGGTSKTGLPIRVLAGLALLEKNPNLSDAQNLLELSSIEEPSVISPNIIERVTEIGETLSPKADFTQWQDIWERDELARRLISEHLLNGGNQYLNHQGELWWFLSYTDGRKSSYISPSTFKQLIANTKNRQKLPNWAGIQIQSDTAMIGDSGHELAKTTTQQPRINISTGVTDVALLERNWQKNRNSSIMMITIASLALLSGIAVVAIGEAKEAKRTREQNNFIASVTHELRAPIGSMRLMAEALETGKVDTQKIPDFHRLIAREGSRLSNLIENVLDLSKIEAGQSTQHHRIINLADLASAATETLQMQAEEKNVSIKLTGEDMDVSVDPLHMQQVLVNLIDNAVKFSPQDGEVTVHWQQHQDKWNISVTDHGPGVPKGEETNIFKRFYRAGEEMNRETQGAGIGLNLVSHVVRAHQGSIAVTNTPGATFTLTFPRHRPNQQKSS